MRCQHVAIGKAVQTPLCFTVITFADGFGEAGEIRLFNFRQRFTIAERRHRNTKALQQQTLFVAMAALGKARNRGVDLGAIGKTFQQRHIQLLAFHGNHVRLAEPSVNRLGGIILIPIDNLTEMLNTGRIGAAVEQKTETKTQWNARQRRHARKLTTSDNRYVHYYSTSTGTDSV